MRSIFVTSPRLPNLLKLSLNLAQILRSRQYTNDGKFTRKLETALQERWGAKHVISMANGTLPILALLGLLPKGSKVLTTPFTFAATTSSIVYSGCFPIYCDVESDSGVVSLQSVRRILALEKVDALLFTHVYGIPCPVDELENISLEYGIPLFFDAAHAFDVEYEGGSVLKRGTASTLSFHATKIFSTGEGGALVTDDPDIAAAARRFRNFGLQDGALTEVGINAKMAELPAALGLANLNGVSKEIRRRLRLVQKYKHLLSDTNLRFIDSPNGSYIPIIFPTEAALLEAVRDLNNVGVYPRRYFFPSLNELHFLNPQDLERSPNSDSLSKTVLCLPSGRNVNNRVIRIITKTLLGAKW